MRVVLSAGALAIALGGCSPESGGGTSTSTAERTAADVTETAPRPQGGQPRAGQPAPVRITLPQLAYSYKLGFRLPGARIAETQDAHRALCDRMGPSRCQLLALTRGTADDAQGQATLRVRVAGSEARRFAAALGQAVTAAGGRTVETNVAAEDVSRNIVDAEARIRQRELLVSRLTEILRTRTGRVAELIEAERSIAQAQEELDAAKAWLAALRGRVAMSDFEIGYRAVAASASPGNAGDQLGETVQGSAIAFLIGLRALLALLIYLAPWALLALPVVLIVRHFRRKPGLPADER